MADENKKKKRFGFMTSFLSKLKTKKYTEYVIAGILALVVVVIFMSSCSKKSNSSKVVEKAPNSVGTELYSETIENKLVNVLSAVKGCGDVKVMVVTDATENNNIAMKNEQKTSSSGNTSVESPIYEKNGSSETPYITSQTYPKITGVLVVASGAGNTNVKLKIINAIVAVLGVDVSKIEVLEGK